MSMEKHINTKVKSGYFQIRNIWAVRQYLTEYGTHTLVNSTVIPKTHYYNALLAECPKIPHKKTAASTEYYSQISKKSTEETAHHTDYDFKTVALASCRIPY